MSFDESLVSKIEALTISDLSSVAEAKKLKDDATKHEKMVEAMRVEAKAPYLEACRKIDKKAKEYTDKLERTKALIVKKISDYENARRQDEARLAQLQSDIIIAITNAETKERAQEIYDASELKNPTIDLVLSQKLESQEGFNKAVTALENEIVIDKRVKWVSEKWDFEIEDPRLVPRQLCTPNDKLIRAAITTENVREIPGVKIYKSLVVR